MAAQTFFRRPTASRAFGYVALGVLAAVPVLAFAFGLNSDSFSLSGPAGPFLAFSAGLLSFVSPCVLPLVPIYITHLSGASVEHGRIQADRRRTFTHALAFVGGLSFVFIALGASVGLLGSYFLTDNQRDLEQIAGAVLVVMGIVLIPTHGRRSPIATVVAAGALVIVFLFLRDLAKVDSQARQLLLAAILMLAWLRFTGYFNPSFLQRTFAVNTGGVHATSYGRSAIVGGAFALGWTPCIGPILGSILTLAATTSTALQGTYLLVAYSIGFSVPFLVTALALADVTRFLRRIQRYALFIEIASGLMLVAVGVLLITGNLVGLNSYFRFADFNGGL